MPELPEVERVRLSLEQAVVGRTVRAVRIHRADVVHLPDNQPVHPRHLLAGRTITAVTRHGKQLAILTGSVPALMSGRTSPDSVDNDHRRSPVPSDADGCLCVHLGMTGRLQVRPRVAPGAVARRRPSESTVDHAPHLHLTWDLSDGARITFTDPRRFGGVWPYACFAALYDERWRKLGEDALRIRPRVLHQRLSRTTRAIKAALLDQQIIAGLGNIYVDELLFNCGLHPAARADRLEMSAVQQLARRMRTLLTRAINAGGSSLRDYVDANGRPGGFQLQHRVYGRGGLPCMRCGTTLGGDMVGGRTTVFCPSCQGLYSPLV